MYLILVKGVEDFVRCSFHYNPFRELQISRPVKPIDF
jgi:hypothetical protein